MKRTPLRFLVLLILCPLALGGAFGHVDGLGLFSQGTQLFAPDHPAHAPFVPEHEHACAACAVSNLTPPAFAPVFFAPPQSRPSPEARADREAPAPALPALSGRSPPSAA
ncbi:MAG: hypothetical protein PT977_13980 [Acidobacteriota bacterium]|nr:hypothetical protein [Acidobacteriota bacterium]